MIIGQYKTIPQILQTNIDLPILPSLWSCHQCYHWHGTTSKYPHLLWISYSSISFSQLNKLSQFCKVRTSHTIIPHSYIFSPFQHSILTSHIAFFYWENLHPDTVFIFTHISHNINIIERSIITYMAHILFLI